MALNLKEKAEREGSGIEVVFADKATWFDPPHISVENIRRVSPDEQRSRNLIFHYTGARQQLEKVFNPEHMPPHTEKLIIADKLMSINEREVDSILERPSRIVYETEVNGMASSGEVILIKSDDEQNMLRTLGHEISHPFIRGNMFEVLKDIWQPKNRHKLQFNADMFFLIGLDEGIAEFLGNLLEKNEKEISIVEPDLCTQIGSKLVSRGVSLISDKNRFVNAFADNVESSTLIYPHKRFHRSVAKSINPMLKTGKEDPEIVSLHASGYILVGSALLACGHMGEQVSTRGFIDNIMLGPTTAVHKLLRKTDTREFAGKFRENFCS